MKVIVARNINSACTIINPSPEFLAYLLSTGLDYDQALTEIAKKDATGMPWRITDKSNLPNDRTFRDAWTDDFETETVDIHNEKAKEIQLKILRSKRNKALKINDQKFFISKRINDRKQIQILTKERLMLLDATEKLKALEITKLNCPYILKEIVKLGNFEELNSINLDLVSVDVTDLDG